MPQKLKAAIAAAPNPICWYDVNISGTSKNTQLVGRYKSTAAALFPSGFTDVHSTVTAIGNETKFSRCI